MYQICFLVLHINFAELWKIRLGSSVKYVRKSFRKTNISNPLIRTRTFVEIDKIITNYGHFKV